MEILILFPEYSSRLISEFACKYCYSKMNVFFFVVVGLIIFAYKTAYTWDY